MNFFELWLLIKPFLEILVLWWIFYRILLFFQGTRAFQVLKGITYLAIIFLLAQLLRFDTLNWLLMKFFAISILAMVIVALLLVTGLGYFKRMERTFADVV